MRENTLAAPSAPESAPAAADAVRPPTRIPLWLILLIATFLLLIGASKGFGLPEVDVVEYQCYARAFWGGPSAVAAAHLNACPVYLGTLPAAPFVALPREYGPLALVPFSLPALAPAALYPWLFAVEMLIVIYGVTALLRRFGAPGAAHAWLFYAMLGSMATAAGRFDVVPSACVVCAVVALRQDRQKLAYVALAAGVLLKLYPLLLLPLFLIHTWRSRQGKPTWRAPATFAGVVAAVVGLAALLNPSRVLDPLRFMGSRCVQVESLPATVSYLWARLTGGGVSYSYSYNATCQQSPGLDALATLCTLIALAGIALVAYLFWRGRISLVLAMILTLCLAMVGTKVFSPQYLLWVSPLVALEYGLNVRAFLAWGAICLATTLCYPLSYGSLLLVPLHATPQQLVPITAALRNLLLAALVVYVLTHYWRGKAARAGAADLGAGDEVTP
ncbi:MAG TPA: glycosyltransferase 87 family protein [Ktedonobacterales bacterium]|nr:glycosyltransferase 87 family protein [Ktedonobacterales bacterium]